MKYKVIASPIKGQKIVKDVTGVRELRDYLAECRELGYDIKSVRRTSKPNVVELTKLQVA